MVLLNLSALPSVCLTLNRKFRKRGPQRKNHLATQNHLSHCSCPYSTDGRQFLKTSTFATVGVAILPGGIVSQSFAASKPKQSQAETLVKTLYNSLSETQRSNVCFEFDHRLGHEIDNNWFIVKDHRVRSNTREQQAMIREIFMKMHS